MPYQGNDSIEIFNARKARQQLRLLGAARYTGFTDLSGLRMWHDTRADHRAVPTEAEADWQDAAIGTQWEGRDQYFWLQFPLHLDPTAAERAVVRLDLGRTGDGYNDGYEGLAYINGERYQAVDTNHEELFLDPAEFGGDNVVSVLMWSGLEGGGPKKIQHYAIKTAAVGRERMPIRDAYTYLWNIIDLIPELADDEPLKYDYVRLVRNTFKRFFWATADTAAITAACTAALAEIHAFTKAHAGQKLGFDVAAIGQTHIDVAWLWRYRHTAEKATRSFTTALRLLKEFPEFKFFYSTPQVHDFIEQRAPELFAQIKDYAKDGRWEADGGTWVEPDTNLPSGESLTRQFLYGSAYFNDKLNAKQTVLWLPDVFGYSYALPQIMKGFGIDHFVTSKISWNDTNRAPHDTFVWRGLDGSEVLTYFLTTTEVTYDYSKPEMFKYTYNGEITPRVILQSYRAYKDKQLNHRIMMPYGFGDGGGGATREMVENIRVINELPGMPRIHNERVDDFFDTLEDQVAQNGEQYPVWAGELYLEYHRGTYTSQAFVKRANRKLEFALKNLELARTIQRVFDGVAYPKEDLNRTWEILMKTQFHDVLPGSAIQETYEDVHADVATMTQTIADLTPAGGTALTLTNPSGTLALGEAAIDEPREGRFALADGTPLAAIRQDQGYRLINVPLAPLASTKLSFTPATLSSQALSGDSIESTHYLVAWNAAGQLTRVFDKDNQREVLLPGHVGNRLTIYEDRPMNFDNWNIDEDYVAKSVDLTAASITSERQDAATVVTFTYRFDRSTVTQKLILAEDSRRIDFDTVADWHEQELLLRTAFDLNIRTDFATYDIQYGNLRRPINQNTSWDTARFEVVGHKWADLSQPDYGVALLNDCKYGYAALNQTLSLSLIKAGTYPDTAADQGEHRFTYSLFAHAGDFAQGQVEQQAMLLNAPLAVSQTDAELPQLFTLQGADDVEVDAIKLSEDQTRVILRLHEFTGIDTTLTVTPHFAAKAVGLTRLDETPRQALTPAADGSVTLTATPYQVLTVAFTL
ncbi:alpha-mannosidase [Lacticaseibacillus suihuaensis]